MRSKIFVTQSLNNFTVLVLQHCVWPITYFLTSFFAWYVKYFFIGGGVFREAACFTERIYLLLFLTNSYIPDWYLTIYFFMLFLFCFCFSKFVFFDLLPIFWANRWKQGKQKTFSQDSIFVSFPVKMVTLAWANARNRSVKHIIHHLFSINICCFNPLPTKNKGCFKAAH